MDGKLKSVALYDLCRIALTFFPSENLFYGSKLHEFIFGFKGKRVINFSPVFIAWWSWLTKTGVDFFRRDRDLRLTHHESRGDMDIIIEVEKKIGWPKLWDPLALDQGPKYIDRLKYLVRVICLSTPCHIRKPPVLCDVKDVPRNSLLFYGLEDHNSEDLLSSINTPDSTFLTYLYSLANLF